MTPELRAAAERVRGNKYSIYDYETYASDVHVLADAYLAEHPSDDDEPVTLEWIKSVLPWTGQIKAKVCGGVPYVVISENIDIKDREQLRSLLKGLGR